MSVSEATLKEELDELSSTEDFLEHFGIGFDKPVVQVNRLHIMQRFHDYLSANALAAGADAYHHYGHWLEQAYLDFVGSSAQEQKALRLFQKPQPGFVSLDEFAS